ncbi:hypothetical protein GGI05_002261 [Coemansia sp. RSA 2603]|nr:hypothetical protein GGI05_002261 [Coemansia sp. RSA 2603]
MNDADLLTEDISPVHTNAPSSGRVSERQSIDDLLLLDDSEAVQTKLPPALLPQTSKSSIGTSQASIGQTKAETVEETDEFGEFLQNNEQPSEIPDLKASKVTAAENKKNALGLTLDKAVSSLTLLSPTQPSSTPAVEESNNAVADQVTKATEAPRDPMDVAADQVLSWMSPTPKFESKDENIIEGEDTILNAWDSAVGLMGGTNIGIHIGEIASRLCSVIPEDNPLLNGFDAQKNTSDKDDGLDLEETDAWKSLLMDAGGAEQSFAKLESPNIEKRVADTIWPCEDNVWSASSEIESETEEDLVQAYLRLTTKVEDSAETANVDTIEYN